MKKGKWFFFLMLMILSNACYKQTTGCLDLKAENFSASSDQACEDCCTYPAINLTFYSDVRPGNWVGNTADSFYIISAGFYMHNFSFDTADGSFLPSNSINLDLKNGNERSYIDDFTSYLTTSTSYTVGEHQERDSIESVQFSLGLPENIGDVDTELIPETHTLAIDGNSLYSADFGYASAFIRIHTDTTLIGDTLLYQIPSSDLLAAIKLDTSFLLDYGEDLNINLIVDVNSWTAGIDFEANGSNIDSIRQIFVENIPNSISLSE